MKIIKLFTLAIILTIFILPSITCAYDVPVNGYYKNNGTYVQPYHRTSPDNTTTNNYGYKW